eukprot:TRINITY_DN6583_c0_g1_i1.p1 TRINITY_DN6583_c0_g1~~TRINITY_DN6583_c0_g1_i1.p1  ORF type:complete len:166 (-),score=36.81 TRINITY_DN6583_c0_g1_i1:106-603(-)
MCIRDRYQRRVHGGFRIGMEDIGGKLAVLRRQEDTVLRQKVEALRIEHEKYVQRLRAALEIKIEESRLEMNRRVQEETAASDRRLAEALRDFGRRAQVSREIEDLSRAADREKLPPQHPPSRNVRHASFSVAQRSKKLSVSFAESSSDEEPPLLRTSLLRKELLR